MTTTTVGRCLLAQILQKKKVTPNELALMTNIHLSQISKFMLNHRSMSLMNARKIAKALNCHIDDLYDWSTFE